MSSVVQVEEFRGDREEWDAFVEANPRGTFFHLIGWRDVLARAFGFRTYYLAVRRDGRLAGVLPLCEVPTGLRGRCLLSLPFAVEAGVCASDDAARRALDDAAVELSAQRGARFLELRDGLDSAGFQVREGIYYRFRRPLHANDADDLAAIPRKRRYMVRKGQRHGLVARTDAADLAAFHDLYARTVRRLGTPVFSCTYFELLRQTFPEQCEILTVFAEARPIAAVLSFLFRDAIMPYYAGSRPESFRLAANDVMYWELMRHARRRGLREIDLGRSKAGTGAFAFKHHWGFEAEPLRYRVYAPTGQRFTERTINDRSVQLLRWGWRRLPLRVTKLLGPALVRRFGPLYT